MSNDDVKARTIEELAIRDIMANEGCRAFMWRCLEMSGIFADNFDPDPYVHARNAGARSQGLWLQRELMSVTPGSYSKMLEESNNVRSSSNRSSSDD